MEEDIFETFRRGKEEEEEAEIEAFTYAAEAGEEEEEEFMAEDEEPNYPNLQPSFKEAQQITVGPMGKAGAKKTKLERAVEAEELGKEGVYLYLNLRPVLVDIFTGMDLSENFANAIVETIREKLPNFWYKNPKALAVAVILQRQSGDKPPTMKQIEALSKKTAIASSDIYRYYKLVKKYNIS